MTAPLILLIEASWAVFLIVWAVTSLQAKATVQRGFGRGSVLWRLVVFAVVVALAQAVMRGWLPRTTFPYGVRAAGATLTVLGIGFAIWARMALGRNWGMPMTLRENPELVTGGPYALVRHPIYTGVSFGLLGTALTVGVWWFFVFLLGFAYFVISARQEEKDMLARFPDAYPAYRARTKMLVPFVF
jgi:protein-S-isoprenylcysteine O-methyltransferase Ste14